MTTRPPPVAPSGTAGAPARAPATAGSVETATAVPESPVSVAVTMRGHRLIQDKLPASGGQDRGPMASELLLASLLACQHSTMVKIAAKRRVGVAIRSIEGAMRFDAAGDIEGIDLRFDFAAPEGTRSEALETLLRLTDAACTISKALRVPVHATYTASPGAPAGDAPRPGRVAVSSSS